jgi:hypothetical protein
VLVVATFSLLGLAQSAPAVRPEFEAAIVKASPDNGKAGVRGTTGLLTLENVPLRLMISVACKTRPSQFTMKDFRTIDYRATIDDSKVFTRPWTIQFNLVRNRDANYEQMEYACVEGEKDLQHYTTGEGGKAK